MSIIVTFYSYKGGVGRSMALANIATLLARRRLRVLAVDWDLEAPGIENYFSSFNVDSEPPGLLRMLMDVGDGGHIDDRRYISSVSGESLTLDLLSSGRTNDAHYSANLERFDWHAFFEKRGGAFLESLREAWRERYDITLIDSRTGLSDSGGICTILLPDVIVAMFTANHQSMYGVRDVVRLAQEARQKLAYDRAQMSVVPVASRFGNDFREAKAWLDRTAEAMSEFYKDWLPAWAVTREVVDQLKIPHVDYFGYGEKLAVIEQGTTDPQGMGFAYEKVAGLLANDLSNAEEIFQLSQPPPEGNEQKPEDAYTLKQDLKIGPPAQFKKKSSRQGYEYDLFVSSEHTSRVDEWVRDFLSRLGEFVKPHGSELRVFHDYNVLEAGQDWPAQTRQALVGSKLLLPIITPRYFKSRWNVAEWKTFKARETERGADYGLILPVVIKDPGSKVPSWYFDRLSFNMIDSFNRPTAPSSIEQIKKLSEGVSYALRHVPTFADGPVTSPLEVDTDH